MGTPESQGRALPNAGRSGGGLVSHVYSVRWNLCLRATAAGSKDMSAAFTTNGCAGAHPPLALTRVFLSYPAFQRIRVVLNVAATFEELTVS